MNVMRVIAKAGPYTVVQELSGVITIHKENGQYICDQGSAYDLIRSVREPEIRAELLKQWAADQAKLSVAEKKSREEI